MLSIQRMGSEKYDPIRINRQQVRNDVLHGIGLSHYLAHGRWISSQSAPWLASELSSPYYRINIMKIS